jgi:predicted acylesterase/phospholipase RssA
MPEPSERTFELGLIMAGAISAGAYTAGVVDFLIEALDAWEAAKAQQRFSGPNHDVRLKVVTGASAGAMTSAIAAVSLHGEVEPVHDVDNPPSPELNRLYDSWVRRVDIAPMLGDEDIRREGKLLSALDASDLDRIAMGALDVPRRANVRAWVADPLAVFLTVANLRGVPYGFRLFGGDGSSQYGMTAHKDHMRFSVSPTRTGLSEARLLDPAEAPKADWPSLAQAALASGAFPIGLRSRALSRPWEDYDDRLSRRPLFPEPRPADSYGFLCVDGGLIDNEPLELARNYLAGGGRNPRNGNEAKRAVIMVDPFPNMAQLAPDNHTKDSLQEVAGAMFGALINQARFKPEELALAESDDNYSRFMISPTRSDRAGKRVEPAMASATLGGFGGFLSERFRKHDFQLGRRNCQRFLQRHFTLPETNPIFDGWRGEGVRDDWHIRIDETTFDRVSNTDETKLLPIIPVVDAVSAEVPYYAAPDPAQVDLDELERLIAARTKSVGAALIKGELREILGFGPARWAARKFFNWRVAPKVAAKARAKIDSELARLK